MKTVTRIGLMAAALCLAGCEGLSVTVLPDGRIGASYTYVPPAKAVPVPVAGTVIEVKADK